MCEDYYIIDDKNYIRPYVQECINIIRVSYNAIVVLTMAFLLSSVYSFIISIENNVNKNIERWNVTLRQMSGEKDTQNLLIYILNWRYIEFLN